MDLVRYTTSLIRHTAPSDSKLAICGSKTCRSDGTPTMHIRITVECGGSETDRSESGECSKSQSPGAVSKVKRCQFHDVPRRRRHSPNRRSRVVAPDLPQSEWRAN